MGGLKLGQRFVFLFLLIILKNGNLLGGSGPFFLLSLLLCQLKERGPLAQLKSLQLNESGLLVFLFLGNVINVFLINQLLSLKKLLLLLSLQMISRFLPKNLNLMNLNLLLLLLLMSLNLMILLLLHLQKLNRTQKVKLMILNNKMFLLLLLLLLLRRTLFEKETSQFHNPLNNHNNHNDHNKTMITNINNKNNNNNKNKNKEDHNHLD
mmetsp:Transcript_13559/g.18603  ORF Transcript_13559/g.18603 Transcript_13559/m.18603 type:complete len:209 (+) Transcript_13559:328-954(+)